MFVGGFSAGIVNKGIGSHVSYSVQIGISQGLTGNIKLYTADSVDLTECFYNGSPTENFGDTFNLSITGA